MPYRHCGSLAREGGRLTPATSETGPFVGDELRLRSVDLILGPATDLHSLFSALAAAADEAELVPHTVHCDRGRDGFRLVATCEVDSAGSDDGGDRPHPSS